MTRAEIIAVAQWRGIPYVEINEPYPGTVEVVADRPRNVHPGAWIVWCFAFVGWLDLITPLWVVMTFRTGASRFTVPLANGTSWGGVPRA